MKNMTKKDLLSNIASVLIERNETIAVAESVTAGLLMSQFSLAEKAMDFFQGGLTVYNLGQKTRQLSIDPILAEKDNSVSELTSTQMAINVSLKFCCPWGIGITGYAVPVPELKIKKCFAIYAVAYNESIIETARIDGPHASQKIVQMHFANSILIALSKILER